MKLPKFLNNKFLKMLVVALCAVAIATLSYLVVPHTNNNDVNNNENNEVKGLFDSLPAFPGAEGFGTKTVGGRGGRIIEVTNLNDSGAGSFRQAVQVESGPRIVVFRVGGVINSRANIDIRNPYLTVAGQSAPGDGIVLKGSRLNIQAHDVIVRGMKVRPGDDPGGQIESRDGISVGVNPHTEEEVYNVVVDHNSISWGLDETASIWDITHGMRGTKLHDVTYSWNIISESLRCADYDTPNIGFNCSRSGNAPFDRVVHGFGFIIGESVKDITVHHNLMANNDFRNPTITQGVSLEFINNVVYNYGLGSMTITYGGNAVGPDDPVAVDVIGNYFKPTAGSLKTTVDGVPNSTIKGIHIRCAIPRNSRVYLSGNIDTIYRPTDSGDEWDAAFFDESCRNTILSRFTKATSPILGNSGINPSGAMFAYRHVLEYAGALAQGVDIVDARSVRTTRDGTSPVSRQTVNGPGNRNNWHIDEPEETGTLPTYRTTNSTQADSDHDGIPNSWETSHGLNPNNSSDGNSISCNGYTWVEEYLNSLIPSTVPLNLDCSGNVASTPAPIRTPIPNSTSTSATPAPTPASSSTTGTVTIQTLMDAYVDSASPTSNFNGDILASQVSSKQIAYLKFDLSSVNRNVSNAVLRIRVKNAANVSHKVRSTSDEWGEATITYNTRKNLGDTIATFTPNRTIWTEIDVTSYVNAKRGLSRASVAIETTLRDDLEFYSSESIYPPELKISY